MRTLPAKYAVEWMMSRAQRVFFVYGMRRSGNHACIGWLTNALEGEPVTLIESDRVNNFNYSNSGRTLFINDIPTMDGRKLVESLFQDGKKIRQAQFIIISAEDKDATYGDEWRIPSRSEHIFIHRNTLNLMASRFQNLNRRACEGLGANLQSMKARFFATLKANIDNPRGVVWEFESWHNDEKWRHEFLAGLELEQDIPPPMVGLGSSFWTSRTLPSAEQLSERFMTVEPRAAWILFIQKAASEYPEVFNAEERGLIRNMTSG